MPNPHQKNINYKHIHTMVLELVLMLKKANFEPEYIIPVAKGGLVPAAILGQYYPEAKFYTLQAKSYDGLDKQKDSVNIFISDSWRNDIKNSSNVLIVDDISDTGDTLKVVVEILKTHLKNMATATLFYKDNKDNTPDFFVESVKKDTWIVFPWEVLKKPRKVK